MGDDHEEEMGGQDEPGGRHLPSAWGRSLPGAITSFLWPWCYGGWWSGYPPTGVCARCRGYRPPLGAGTKRPVASPPLHNSPTGASRRLAPAGVGGGGGAWGSAGPLRTPGGPHCLYNEPRATRARTARAGRAAPAGVGDRGGDWGPDRWDRSPAGLTTLHVGVTVYGVLGAPPRGRRPPPFGYCVLGEGKGRRGREGKGHSRP